jgi:hypothetical protein
MQVLSLARMRDGEERMARWVCMCGCMINRPEEISRKRSLRAVEAYHPVLIPIFIYISQFTVPPSFEFSLVLFVYFERYMSIQYLHVTLSIVITLFYFLSFRVFFYFYVYVPRLPSALLS